jgi:hypothetical protein
MIVKESISFERGKDPKDILKIGLPKIPDNGLEFPNWCMKIIKVFYPKEDGDSIWNMYDTITHYAIVWIDENGKGENLKEDYFTERLLATGFNEDMVKIFNDNMHYFDKYYDYL